VLDKSRMHGFAGAALIPFAIGGTPSVGARGRQTLVVGDLACAILRRVLCHAGNDGGCKGPRALSAAPLQPAIDLKGLVSSLGKSGRF
jgi:hypothetical protein